MDAEIDYRANSILHDDNYVHLLGAALYTFTQMCNFAIELLYYTQDEESWYDLIRKTSGLPLDRIRDNEG